MSKLLVAEFMTLDGVIEAPQNWRFPYSSEDFDEFSKGQILLVDAMLLGRKTYEEFAPVWSQMVNNEFGIADKLNNTPKYVVSTTLDRADWSNSTLIKDNVVEAVRQLKERGGGDISLTGSATLAQTLIKAGLIDRYVLMVHPIVVGKGLRLFKEGQPGPQLKLVDSRSFKSGIVALTYQPENAVAE